MTRWGMVIDLQKCVGCDTCTAVCSQMNYAPSNTLWRQVFPLDRKIVARPETGRLFLPMNCMHCSDPPCLEVCPTTATYRHPNGVVDIYDDLCIGCGYCVVACPYLARTISHYDPVSAFGLHGDDTTISDRSDICTKCNFCLPRVEAGIAQGFRAGLDAEASPNCVQFCIADALHFGDLHDPDSHVFHLIRENNTVRLQESMGTDPAIHYIVRDDYEGMNGAEVEMVSPRKQRVWRWPAAANFILGGMGAGLYLLSWFMLWLGMVPPTGFELLAPALAALGFLSLAVEVGRPLRGLYLFRALHHSWMSREALAGVLFMGTAVLSWVWPHTWLSPVAALSATGLLISQGLIIHRAYAVTAWHKPAVPWWVSLSGLEAGSGLVMLLAGFEHMASLSGMAFIGVFFLIAGGINWMLYLSDSKESAFRAATAALRTTRAFTLSIGVGHVLPILLLLALSMMNNQPVQIILALLAGMSMIIGSAAQKLQLILKAGYLHGIVAGPVQNGNVGNGRMTAAAPILETV